MPELRSEQLRLNLFRHQGLRYVRLERFGEELMVTLSELPQSFVAQKLFPQSPLIHFVYFTVEASMKVVVVVVVIDGE